MILNYFAVIVAAIVALVVGSAWYAPFMFGKQWLRLRGEDPRQDMRTPFSNMALEFVCVLVTAYVLSIFTVVFGAHTAYAAILLGVIIWVGFYVTMLLSEVVWEGKPFALFLINAGLRLVNIVLMALIVGLWQ
jgi:hypothetical protein